MCLQVRRIDHELIRFAAFRSQHGEYPVEHTKAAPLEEAVVDRLG
jgi:hypothetical protein